LTPSAHFYTFAGIFDAETAAKGPAMRGRASVRFWLILIVLASLGAKGCPTQVGCGVSGSLASSPRGFSADTWSCNVGMQIAKGVSVTTPQQARTDLIAKKDQVAVQVASLRDQLKNGDRAFGFGGKDDGAQPAQVENQLKTASENLQRLDAQVGALDQLQPPQGTTALTDGTWTMQGDKPVFQTQAPYEPGKRYVIPYVLRSEQGEVIETGFLAVESIQVESGR
jgi:hypothetical protein